MSKRGMLWNGVLILLTLLSSIINFINFKRMLLFTHYFMQKKKPLTVLCQNRIPFHDIPRFKYYRCPRILYSNITGQSHLIRRNRESLQRRMLWNSVLFLLWVLNSIINLMNVKKQCKGSYCILKYI